MPLRDTAGPSGVTVSSFRTNYTPSARQSMQGPPLPSSARIRTVPVTSIDNNQEFDTGYIPLVHEPSGVYSIAMTDSDMIINKKKFIKVSSVGEIEVCPDRVEFCVQIACIKADVATARESVRKRSEFLMLALKKVGVPPHRITSTTLVKKFNLGDEADENNDDVLEIKILRNVEKHLTMKNKKGNDKNNNENEDPMSDAKKSKVIKELYVICSSLNQYMELFSIVNEKLDRQVNVSPPIIRVSPEYLQTQTQEAAKLAMNNAIQKANHLLQTQRILRASVGKLFYSVEDSLTVTDITEYQNISTSTTFESLKWKRNNKLIICKLTSMFEVNTTKGTRKL